MQTTTLIAELLVIGSICQLWFTPILERIIKVNIYIYHATNELIIFIAIIYLLGIVVNLISDKVFSPIDKRIALNYNNKEHLQKIRCKVLSRSVEASSYMLTKRSIIRIYRSSSLNFLFITALSLLSIYDSYVHVNKWQLSLFSFFLFILTLYGYVRSLKGYFKFLITMEAILNDESK